MKEKLTKADIKIREQLKARYNSYLNQRDCNLTKKRKAAKQRAYGALMEFEARFI